MEKIFGIRKCEFDAKDGNHISGYNLYVGTDIPEKYGEGYAVDRYFVSSQKVEDCGCKVGDEVRLSFNRYGKIAYIEIV